MDMDERFFRQLRAFLEEASQKKVDENTPAATVVSMDLLYPIYKQTGTFTVGDIRTDPETRQPHRCILGYDADLHPDWTLKTPTLWVPYHSTDPEAAYPWAAPTGAHDIYQTGEYMTFTDQKIYKALQDTSFSPDQAPSHWELIE